MVGNVAAEGAIMVVLGIGRRRCTCKADVHRKQMDTGRRCAGWGSLLTIAILILQLLVEAVSKTIWAPKCDSDGARLGSNSNGSSSTAQGARGKKGEQ